MRPALLTALVPLVAVCYALGQGTSENICARTASMQIFSNAFVSEETGDVGGFELALKQHKDSTVEAMLFVYEGAATNDGIALPGHVSGKKLTITGDWVEHLVEYPSKKEIVQTHFVKIDGTLDSDWFRGKIEIADMVPRDKVRLKRVERIWVCRTPASKKP